MKIIRISGVIADWQMEREENVTPATLKKSLDEANGEDVLILINSPGGEVYQGLEMFSMIKNYSGHTETRPVSLAASMGSIMQGLSQVQFRRIFSNLSASDRSATTD